MATMERRVNNLQVTNEELQVKFIFNIIKINLSISRHGFMMILTKVNNIDQTDKTFISIVLITNFSFCFYMIINFRLFCLILEVNFNCI